ncbi:MAG: DUF2946 family protein [Alphaproteobacteria bacterium]
MVKSDTYFSRVSKSLALFAMVIMLLAQTTPIWAKQSDATSLVICTALGLKTISVDENGTEQPTPAKGSSQHCSVCHLATDIDVLLQIQNAETSPAFSGTTPIQWPILLAPNGQENGKGHAIRAPPAYT